MTAPSLVLVPAGPVVAWDALTASLTALGFIGAAQTPDRFQAGAQLWDWVCLLGCAPVWQQPPEIHLARFPQAQFWLSACAPPPRCPDCRARLGLACDPYAAAPGVVPLWSCAACGGVAPATAWKLGRYAVYAAQWLALSPVYPGEAVPTDTLLTHLTVTTGVGWDYAYCGWCQPPP